MQSSNKARPSRTLPMRLPGQSLIESMRERLGRDLRMAIPVVIALALGFGMIIGALLLAQLGSMPARIIIGVWLLIASIAALLMIRRFNASEKQDARDELGITGERIVAEALDALKRDGYRIFHDVPPERAPEIGETLANFDHIVIGPQGVFIIETKMRSKSRRNNEIIIKADGRVLVNGREPDRCPLKQAKALARAMREMLQRETGINPVPVKPVVIYPGWYIKDRAYRNAGGDVWTLNEKAFVKWIGSPKNETRLNSHEIDHIAAHIESRVRPRK